VFSILGKQASVDLRAKGGAFIHRLFRYFWSENTNSPITSQKEISAYTPYTSIAFHSKIYCSLLPSDFIGKYSTLFFHRVSSKHLVLYWSFGLHWKTQYSLLSPGLIGYCRTLILKYFICNWPKPKLYFRRNLSKSVGLWFYRSNEVSSEVRKLQIWSSLTHLYQ